MRALGGLRDLRALCWGGGDLLVGRLIAHILRCIVLLDQNYSCHCDVQRHETHRDDIDEDGAGLVPPMLVPIRVVLHKCCMLLHLSGSASVAVEGNRVKKPSEVPLKEPPPKAPKQIPVKNSTKTQRRSRVPELLRAPGVAPEHL